MAKLIKNDYRDYGYWDEYTSPSPYCSWYEEDGLIFKFFPNDRQVVYVSGIEDDVETVSTPEYLSIKGKQIPVSKWNVCDITQSAHKIKKIIIGKSINDFPIAS